LQRTGISVPLIDNLPLMQLSPRPLKRSVRLLRGTSCLPMLETWALIWAKTSS
jgi:hypothetical protein